LSRKKIEGRHVPREVFDYAIHNSGLNVLTAKQKFGDKIRIYLIEKDWDGSIERMRKNIGEQELESFLKKL
jgi:hypothetical protein